MNALLQHKACFIDLDGTMYRGDELIDGAIEFITYLQKEGIPFYFLTNNAMRTHSQNKEKMEKMGFPKLQEDQFFTSAMAAASYVRRHRNVHRAFYIGEDGMREALEEQGYEIVDNDAEAVFIGLNVQATYEQYCTAFYHLQKGAILVGTNEDRRLPHGDHFRIGNGAIVHMMEYCSEQQALMIGKPNAPIMEEALAYAGVHKEDCLMIGDNLETDVAFGIRQGMDTIFVTTGVHKEEDCTITDEHLVGIVHNLKELLT